jgi:hypothetical protein
VKVEKIQKKQMTLTSRSVFHHGKSSIELAKQSFGIVFEFLPDGFLLLFKRMVLSNF